MTRTINSTFEYQENTYKVVEDITSNGCEECDLHPCLDIDLEITGRCSDFARTDDTDVHFELINIDDNEHQLHILENNMNIANE